MWAPLSSQKEENLYDLAWLEKSQLVCRPDVILIETTFILKNRLVWRISNGVEDIWIPNLDSAIFRGQVMGSVCPTTLQGPL